MTTPLRSPGTETRLRVLRRTIGLSQAEFARRIKVDKSAVCRIELGQAQAWPKFRRDAAAVLGVAEDVLFGDR